MVWKYFQAESPDVFPGITARNRTTLEYEKFVHRTFFPTIIHPYSRFRVYYEAIVMATFPLRMTAFLFVWSFLRHSELPYLLYVTFMQLFCTVDLFLMFFTGYVQQGTEIVILTPKKIARRYLSTLFVLDFLACLPCELIMRFCFPGEGIIVACENVKGRELIIFATSCSNLLGAVKFFLYLKNTSNVFLWNPFSYGLLSTLFGFNLILVFNLSVYYIVVPILHDVTNKATCRSLVEDVKAFFMVLAEMGCNIFFLYEIRSEYTGLMEIPGVILSFFFNIVFAACFIKYLRGKLAVKETAYVLESKIRCMARKRHLPKSLSQKTLLYFSFLLQNKFRTEDAVFSFFPEDFKADVISFRCLPLVKGFYAFEDLPSFVLRRLAESLKYQLHLPNELVVTKNDSKLSMYFVQRGTVALYSENNVELYHFEDGSSFYGRSLIEGKTPKRYYAISLEVSEVYRLEHSDFMEIMQAEPKLLESVKEKLYSGKSENYDLAV